MFRNTVSLLVLAVVGMTFMVGSLAEAKGGVLVVLVVTGAFFAAGLVGHYFALKNNPVRVGSANYLPIMVTAVIAMVVTWGLSVELGLNVCVASGLVGIFAALILPGKLAAVAYAASFAGMSSSAVITGLPMVICAGLLVGGLFILATPVYEGYGGKLGTIAAGAVLVTVLIFGTLGVG